MSEKKFNTRVFLKNDIEANWMQAKKFIPNKGEIIIYNAESETDKLPEDRTYRITYERFKVGNGIDNVNDLHFQGIGQKTAEGGEIFNNYDYNKALAEGTFAAGYVNQAGYMGYKIIELELLPADEDVKTQLKVTLDDFKDFERPYDNYAVGDIVQMHLQSHFHDRYTIASISDLEHNYRNKSYLILEPTYGDIITDKLTLADEIEDYPDGSRNWLYVIGKPYGEPIKFSKGATALGYGNIATGQGSLATGIVTKALGYGSFTAGSGTRAGYTAIATGVSSEAMHNRSTAMGYGSKTGRVNQTVVGQHNEVETDSMFVVGGGEGDAPTLRKTLFKVKDNGDICGTRDLNIDGEITTKGRNLTDDLNEINYQLASPERYTIVDSLPKDTTNYANMYLVKNPEATLGFDKFLYNDTGKHITEASAIWDGTLVEPTINEDGAYEIDTAEKLAYVIKNGGTVGEETGCYFIITKDIYLNDITKVNWATGKATSGYSAKKWYSNNTEAGQKIGVAFNGTIDGGYHTIHGIYIPYKFTFSTTESKNCAGLIPYIDENSDVIIKNLSIDNAFMKTRGHVGAIVGQTRGPIKIDNCSVGANVYLGASSAGAIRGGGYANSSSAIITNCYSLANLNLTDSNGNLPIEKGICGHFWDKSVEITSCFNANGPICSVDYKKTRIKDSYATEEVVALEGVTINSIENMQGLDVLTNPNKMPLLEKLHQFKASEGYPIYKFASFGWIKVDDSITKEYVKQITNEINDKIDIKSKTAGSSIEINNISSTPHYVKCSVQYIDLGKDLVLTPLPEGHIAYKGLEGPTGYPDITTASLKHLDRNSYYYISVKFKDDRTFTQVCADSYSWEGIERPYHLGNNKVMPLLTEDIDTLYILDTKPEDIISVSLIEVESENQTVFDYSDILVTVTDSNGVVTVYNPNTDGVVSNIKSSYPSMSITTNTSVEINCEYLRDSIISDAIGMSAIEADITYNPGSENAQSGKAVAEAVANMADSALNVKGSSTGTTIEINDISSIPHYLKCKVEYKDFGKNLKFSPTTKYEEYWPNTIILETSIEHLEKDKYYYISVNNGVGLNNQNIWIDNHNYDYGSPMIFQNNNQTTKIPITENMDTLFIFQASSINMINNISIIPVDGPEEVPINIIDTEVTVTDNEGNIEIYKPNSDGILNNLKSKYPLMNIKSNTSVNLTCEYVKDTQFADIVGMSAIEADITYNPESKNAQSGKAVAEAVAKMVDSAPETLNTLNELANALGDDPNFATTVANQIGQKANKSDIENLVTKNYVDNKFNETKAGLILTDNQTGVNYRIYISDGKLNMEVAE